MPFKIVNTIEKGKSVLVTVPSEWEKEGSLFWPRQSSIKVNNLRRLENSKPKEDWKIINCILKRSHLSTFEHAEAEIERMCSHSDTETDNEKENKTVKSTSHLSIPFESIVQECLNNTEADYNKAGESSETNQMEIQSRVEPQASSVTQKLQVKYVSQEPPVSFVSQKRPVISISQQSEEISTSQECPLISISEDPEEIFTSQQVDSAYEHPVTTLVQESQQYSIENLNITDGLLVDSNILTKIDNLITKVNTIQDNQTILQANINVVIENQKMFYESQQQMMLHFSQVVTQVEEYMNKCSRSTKQNENADFKLIENHEQLRSFEQLLQNSEKALEIKSKLSSICGKGKGRGINNAYCLVDAMFDRHFLKTCSWAGGSRTTETEVCFKSFTKVINIFFEIVQDSDNSFTLNECHTFFKNVLKNSSQRCNSKKLRTSTTKHRPKKSAMISTNNTPGTVLGESDKTNKTTPSGRRQSNLRMPLNEVQNNNTSDDFEVFV